MIETKQPQIQCVIVVPTRELARQIHQDLSPIAAELKIKSANLFGGIDLTVQTSQLENLPHMVIATPGRLLALLNAKTLDLSAVKHLVFDEVDWLLDMGFWTDIQSIIKDIPPQRQILCFSATLTNEVEKEVESILESPVRLNAHDKNSVVDAIEEHLYLVNKGSKTKALLSLLGQQADKQSLIFSNTKDTANTLAKKLLKAGLSVSVLHGKTKEQAERDQALNDFKHKKIKTLIATDEACTRYPH